MNKLGKLTAMHESYSVWYKFIFEDDMSTTIKDAFHGQLIVYKMDNVTTASNENRLGESV